VCTSRVLSIFMINEGYEYYQISSVLMMKALGNLFSMFNFKRMFLKLGTFRLLTISITIVVQSIIIIFAKLTFSSYLLAYLLFGFFEQSSKLILDPLLSDFFQNSNQKPFDIVLGNFIRFMSGFFIIIGKDKLGFILISLATITLVPYALSEARNLFRKDYINAYDSRLLFVFNHYKIYFVSSFLNNICSYLLISYLIILLSNFKISHASSYLSFYLWGQFVFYYPSKFLIELFQKKINHVVVINSFIIFISSIAAFVFYYNPVRIFYGINVFYGLSIALMGGAFSFSLKVYLSNIKKEEDEFSVYVTENQIKSLASFFGVLLGLVIMKFNVKNLIFITIILINLLNIIYIYFDKYFESKSE
ncbi:MAG: hypothetical protein ACK5XN_22210, partial [Bacteroidota bacterium]